MPRATRLLLVVVALGSAGCVAVFGRPARLRSARLVHNQGGSAPEAVIMLAYTRGLRPTSVIVDIHSSHGSGSATADGDDDEVRVPLSAPLTGTTIIMVQMATRLLGRCWTHQRRFTH